MPTPVFLPALAGQPAQQVLLPTFWPDITLSQYLALTAPGAPPAEQLLTGLTAAQWAALDEPSRTGLSERLEFVADKGPLQALPPTPGLYEVGACAYGLLQLAQQRLAALPGAHAVGHGAVLYALYRAPAASPPTAEQFEAAHAAALARPVTEVVADCLFLLGSYERCLVGQPAAGPSPAGVLRLADAQARPLGTQATAGRRGLLARLFSRHRQAA